MSNDKFNEADESRWIQGRRPAEESQAPPATSIPIYGTPAPTPPMPSVPTTPATTPPSIHFAATAPPTPPVVGVPAPPTPPTPPGSALLQPLSPNWPPTTVESPVAPTTDWNASAQSSSSQPLLSGSNGAGQFEPPAVISGGGGRMTWIAAVIGALALLMGGGFFALSALGASGGGATPEEAVDMMVAAINEEDFLTLGEMVEPGERRTLVEPTVNEILPELKRLGVFSDELDAGDVEGIDFELTDIEYRIDEIPGHDDLVHVYFTDGESSSSFTADDFPFGDAIRSRFGDLLEDDTIAPAPVEETDEPIVLVERNGRWYFSMWYTIAENARIEFGEDLPSIGRQPIANGSDSPEAAVELFVSELVDFDLVGAIGSLDPDEASALYRYSPLFLDDAQDFLDESRRSLNDEGVTWAITDMDFDVDNDGDDAVVTIRGFKFVASGENFELEFEWARERITASFSGDFGEDRVEFELAIAPELWTFEGRFGEETLSADVVVDRDARTLTLTGNASGDDFSGEFTIDEDANCSSYSFRGPDIDESGCLEDGFAGGDLEADFFASNFASWFDEIPEEFGGIDMATHKTDGEWFVSPTSSVMNSVVSTLQNLDQETFDEYLDSIEAGDGRRPFDLDGQLEDLFSVAGGFGGNPNNFILDESFIPLDDVDPFNGGLNQIDFFIEAGVGQQSYTDTLDGVGDAHLYNISLEAGEAVGVTAYGVAGDLPAVNDTEIEVLGPDGSTVAYNDDFEGLNSGLQFIAADSGQYRILVNDLGFGTGTYELTVEVVPAGQTPTIGDTPSFAESSAAAVGSTFYEVIESNRAFSQTESIDSGVYDLFNIDVPPDQTVTITLSSDDFDSYLVVLDGTNFESVADNDDAFDAVAQGLNQLDSQIVLQPGSGSYFVEVHALADFGGGNYTLTISAG